MISKTLCDTSTSLPTQSCITRCGKWPRLLEGTSLPGCAICCAKSVPWISRPVGVWGRLRGEGSQEAAPMTRRSTIGIACSGLMNRHTRGLSFWHDTSGGRAPRSFGSASPRGCRRSVRRAGRCRSRHSVLHAPASMAGAHERRPVQDVAMGDHQGAPARHPEPSPSAGTPDHYGVPPANLWTCPGPTASQVTPPHAPASGASAMSQVARAMPQRRPSAAV
jgi:hypothetical protein